MCLQTSLLYIAFSLVYLCNCKYIIKNRWACFNDVLCSLPTIKLPSCPFGNQRHEKLVELPQYFVPVVRDSCIPSWLGLFLAVASVPSNSHAEHL